MMSSIITIILQSTILLELFTTTSGELTPLNRLNEAKELAKTVFEHFFLLFQTCADSTMPKQQFLIDDLQTFVNFRAKTTVGVFPKYTSDRKFFVNLISTMAFKNMLAKDVIELRQNFIEKLQFCDEAVMDQTLLQDLYDREVDLSKL